MRNRRQVDYQHQVRDAGSKGLPGTTSIQVRKRQCPGGRRPDCAKLNDGAHRAAELALEAGGRREGLPEGKTGKKARRQRVADAKWTTSAAAEA